MPLYQRNETWWVSITTARGRVRESAGTADRKAAQEYHDQLAARLWREDRLGERSVAWGEAAQKWMAVKPRGLPDLYRLKALDIPQDELLPMSTERAEGLLAGRGAGSWNRTLALLVAIHNTSRIKPPEVERRRQPAGRTRWLTKDEWGRLRRSLAIESPLLRQAAEFTLATGLRENNVLGLAWNQVDLKRRVAWIHADQTKAKQPIGVPLNDNARAVLMERSGVDPVLVFGNPDYVLYKASNKAWYKALRRAKLVGFRWHDLRHTWASWAVMNGVRIEELQRLGGWKTLAMVQRYSHLAPEHLASVAAKVKPVGLRAPRKRVTN